MLRLNKSTLCHWHHKKCMSNARKLSAIVGNGLLLVGLYLFLFTGGLMATEQYNVYAAQGDITNPESPAPGVTPAAIQPRVQDATPMQPSAGLPSIARNQPEELRQPESNAAAEGAEDQLSNALLEQVPVHTPSTITRIEI